MNRCGSIICFEMDRITSNGSIPCSDVPLHVTHPPEIRHPVPDRITHMVREEPQTYIWGQFIRQVESVLILPEEPGRPLDQEVDGILLRQGHPLGIWYLTISPEVLQSPDIDPVRCIGTAFPERAIAPLHLRYSHP